jgi:hypothetical protein
MEIGKNAKGFDEHYNRMDNAVVNFLACLKEKDPAKKAAMMKAADEKMKGLSEESQKKGYFLTPRNVYVSRDMQEMSKDSKEEVFQPDWNWDPKKHGNRSFWD